MISPGCNTPRLNRLPRLSSTTQVSRGRRLAFFGQGCLALYITLVFGVSTVQAQTAVCSNTPATGERIECTEDATSTSDIDIDALGINIDTSGYTEHGIYGFHQGAGNIDIDVSADASGEQPVRSTIDTTGQNSHGVYGKHEGTDGNVDIQVDSTDITTTSDQNAGIHGFGIHGFINASGNGDIFIETLQSTIDTAGDFGVGVSGLHNGVGDITITLQQGSEIDTMGNTSYAVRGLHRGDGEAVINLGEGVDICTTGKGAAGVYLRNQSTNTGSSVVTVNGSIIKTEGSGADGIWNTVEGGTGDSRTDVRNSTVTTMGYGSSGIHGYHTGLGDIDIFLQGGSITTESTDLDPTYLDTFAHGIYARHQSIGDIKIDLQGGSIETKGLYSYGVYARHQGDGDITIGTLNGHTITTTGDYGYGILAHHEGTMDSRTISLTVGGTIDASGAGAQGVRVGRVNADGEPERVAAIGADGYRQQTVTVNGAVTSAAEGVYLAGGGRVVIGPGGSIASDSGIAILATGTVPEVEDDSTTMDINEATPAIPPKLRVDLNLGGRRVAEAIGDDWIINDGGETTIAVNNVVLHEGATGVTGNTARNGAWNVTMREDGVTVDRSDPNAWVITEPAAGVVADRDFSTEDFNEAARPQPPPPPPEPEPVPDGSGDAVAVFLAGGSQIVNPMSDGSGDTAADFLAGGGQVVKQVFSGLVDAAAVFLAGGGQVAGELAASVIAGRAFSAEVFIEAPGSRKFHEVYAPRAALYEALPGFLLRLGGGGPAGERVTSPGSPVWARLSGSTGSHAPDHATVGAEYDFNRFTAQVGLDVGMGEHFTGSISVRHVTGSAEVSSPFGRGDIEADGIGVSLGASWKGAGGYYANGSLSLTNYDMDIDSGDRSVGTLKKDAAARGNSLGIEAGRRIKMNGKMNLTPRAWATRSEVSIDTFTDSAGAHFSLDDARRLTGGVGVVAETARAWDGGTFSLHGSVDVEQKLDDAETLVDVSGEKLESKSAKTRLLLGLGGVYRVGRFSVSGEVSMGGLGSDDAEYAGRVSIGMRF